MLAVSIIREKECGYSGWTNERVAVMASQRFGPALAEGRTERCELAIDHRGPRQDFRGRTEMAIATINPTTGQVLKTFEALSDAQIEVKLQKAADTFLSYRKVLFAERAQMMLKAAAILDGEKESFARVMTTEMGKTFRSAVDEGAKCAWVCRYYAENAERFLADEIVETTASRSYIRYQPLGAVLAVMPWNFPFWQVLRFAAPALMAGNVGLLKHASI